MEQYDFFKKLAHGECLWIGLCNNRQEAERTLNVLARVFGSEYYAVSVATQEKIQVRSLASCPGNPVSRWLM
jgi:hypothetical protein